jgi:hypothetical protein
MISFFCIRFWKKTALQELDVRTVYGVLEEIEAVSFGTLESILAAAILQTPF